jgi:hypothetical protein
MAPLAETGTKQSIWRRFLAGFRAFCGGFVIYLAVGGLAGFTLGFALKGHRMEEPSCLPFHTVFAQIVSKCPKEAVNVFWAVTIGTPRFLITPPALAIARYKAVLKSAFNWRWLLEACMWTLYSIPLVLLIWAGTSFWWNAIAG